MLATQMKFSISSREMPHVHIKGFQIFRDRRGKMRCYHRQTRSVINLDQAPLGSAEFFAECAQITELTKVVGPPKPGTLGLLIAEYKGGTGFRDDLAPRTRADYQKCFNYLKPISDTPLHRFDRPLVIRIRDKARDKHGRRFANYVKAVLSILFTWGAERGYVTANPAEKIKNIPRAKNMPAANRPWGDDERHVVLEQSDQLLTGLAVMMFTGLGPKDALRLPRTFYKDGEIAIRRSKTGEPVFWPAPEPLSAILEAAVEHHALALCANSRGRPWTESGFRASWARLRRRLEKEERIGPGLTLYGLRHTVAVILRELGYDDRAIADALGQKSPAMALHYAEGADLKRKMKGIVSDFQTEVNRRRMKVVKPT
jgi:integrase